MSPDLFNPYSEMILWNYTARIMTNRTKIKDLRYADDVVLIAALTEYLQKLFDAVATSSKHRGSSISSKKTRWWSPRTQKSLHHVNYIMVAPLSNKSQLSNTLRWLSPQKQNVRSKSTKEYNLQKVRSRGSDLFPQTVNSPPKSKPAHLKHLSGQISYIAVNPWHTDDSP